MSATKKKTLKKEKDTLAPPKKTFGLRKRLKGNVEDKDAYQKEPQDENPAPQEEYEVELIVGKQVLENITFYQVKWKGFSMEETTWEPAANLENAPMKIRDYENSLKEKKKSVTKASVQKSIKDVSEPNKLLGKRSKAEDEKSETNLEKSRKNFRNKNTKKKSIKKKETLEPGVETDQGNQYNDEKVCQMTKLAYHHEIGFIDPDKITLSGGQDEQKKIEGIIENEKKETPTPQVIETTQINQSNSNKNNYLTPNETQPIINTVLYSGESEKKTPNPYKSSKPLLKIHRNQDEYGSFGRGDTPVKVIGVRHTKEKCDLEVMVSWKLRDDGTQPINSKVTRLELLQKGFWMPLLHFYESKMKMENSPDFNPDALPKF